MTHDPDFEAWANLVYTSDGDAATVYMGTALGLLGVLALLPFVGAGQGTIGYRPSASSD